MGILSLLPSAQFTLIAVSLTVSAGLVVAAERLTRQEPAHLAATQTAQPAQAEDWQEALQEIQAQSGIASPVPPPQEVYQELLAAAQSENVTESAARTLFITLSNAGAQGLGSDIPTQERLVAGVLAQIEAAGGIQPYTAANLTTTSDTAESLYAYGNTLMQTLSSQPNASTAETFRILSLAADNDDATYFEELEPIEAAYRRLVTGFLAVEVPSTLVPLHLSIVNNFSRIAEGFVDLRATPKDPLRGLTALYTFDALTDETSRVFTTIAQQFQQSGILFTKDEPGSTWSVFLPISP